MKQFYTLLGLGLALASAHVPAATFNIANGDVVGLQSAITTANANAQDDTIELAAGGLYTLTARDSFLNGLPQLGADGGHQLIIHGNGATIQRVPAVDDSAHRFRIFETRSGANVTLTRLTLTNGNLSSGTVAHGGAIYNNRDEASNATLTIANCTISNCSGDYGGAIYSDGGGVGNGATLVITNSTFSGNFSINNGGAIFSDGSLSGNATLTVSGCAFFGNSNSHSGGGTIQHDGFSGTVTGSINNSTFSGNSSAGNGGCVYMDGESGTAQLSVSNCTLSGNSAVSGGAIYISNGSGGTATLRIGNTLLETGATGDNINTAGGTIFSMGYNLSDDAAGGNIATTPGGFLDHTGDTRNTDPLTDPAGIKDNGGPTQTVALRSTSPAIDQGNRSTIGVSNNDQRGEPRPVDDPFVAAQTGGDSTDIGAYETDVRVISETRNSSDLVLTFMTILGHTYEIQSRPNLLPATPWSTVPGSIPAPPIAGTGGIVQVTVPGAIGSGPGFYRLRQF
jgi:predicted outer membrane repeat protein